MTVPYAEVIGDPVARSKSPAIHRFWLSRLGIAADYRATRVTADTLPDYLAARAADPLWRGCNVTMPLKQRVQPHLHAFDRTARAIGAVNTVVRGEERRLTGCNTDAAGFLDPLRPLLAQRHWFRMARVLGTGGAARAVVYALAGTGFTLVLAGRDAAKAQSVLDSLAPEGGHHSADLACFAQPTDFAFDAREGCLDLVVNTTPLGMRGHGPLRFDLSHAPPGSLFYDIVTDPVKTELLLRATAAGHATFDGLHMLIAQAAAAFALFFGQPAPREHDAELRALLAA
ncbi:shikimate dehydrogenase [Erythrobacteraceae bacterium CFH 75059]|uniref:shikimate dehydrogenase family protein n=1 Tax=Qipengyuania thermophila TaxID=2509361 RepID=UPI00102100BF|nr:shikimate dehydrogenase [Qipengyuania thermophila]TCD06687.1 shikimate dehydrogenase [Erythrobacteraceae bacterium CFH 75059]